MKPTNYHTHSRFCDGVGEPEEYVRSAVQKGFAALGFSSHAPLPFPNEWTMNEESISAYRTEIRRLAEKYRDQLQVYLGLEIDYIPGIIGAGDEKYRELDLDYTIGSVHMILSEETGKYLSIDGPFEEYEAIIREVFSNDARAFVEYYYSMISQMMGEHRPDIVGHFDIVMKNNRNRQFFTGEEPWYLSAAERALDAIQAGGSILEVNSGGMARKKTDFLYPSLPLLKAAKERGIPIMMNADAHAPDQIDAYYDIGYKHIRHGGYREVRVLLDGEWKSEPLS